MKEDKRVIEQNCAVSRFSMTYEVAPLGTVISRVSHSHSPSIGMLGKANCHSVRSIWRFHCLFNFSLSSVTNVLYLDVTNRYE